MTSQAARAGVNYGPRKPVPAVYPAGTQWQGDLAQEKSR
jgi:hypothetical protein